MNLIVSKTLISLGLLAFSSAAFGDFDLKPPVGSGGIEPPISKRVTGSIIFQNCSPEKTQVRVRLNPGTSVQPTTRIATSNGVKFTYSVLAPTTANQFTVTPSVTPGACAAGKWSPTSRTLSDPASNINFTYAVNAKAEKRISLGSFVKAIDTYLAGMKMYLNNNKTQSSYVQLSTFKVPFQIPRTVVDIDCGVLCPDLGDALFYLNDITMRRADFLQASGGLKIKLNFEDRGREIKGYHNKLGDNFVPDFDVTGFSLEAKAFVRVNNGRMTLGFSTPKLNADIKSTGGCNISGIDICNKLFGTDRKIQKSVETATLQTLNGSLVQQAIAYGVAQYLKSVGIEQQVLNARIEGNVLVISTL